MSPNEADEDAFSEWNRDIDEYVPTLWDAYLFGLNRGRSGMEAILALNVEIMRAEDGKWLLVDFRPWTPRTTEHETCQAAIAAALSSTTTNSSNPTTHQK